MRSCFKGHHDLFRGNGACLFALAANQGERPICDIDFGTDEPGWLFPAGSAAQPSRTGQHLPIGPAGDELPREPARNDSKGLRGVMRSCASRSVRLAYASVRISQDAFRLQYRVGCADPWPPTGALTGGVLAVLILALTDGASLREGHWPPPNSSCEPEPGHEETLRAIEMAEELADSGLPHEEAIARLGQGWIAEEALAISIYCALVARNFKHGVILAVNHDGDSDSTGAIVGNLLGAMHGVKAIPAEWLEPLELRDVITELAEDLYAFKDWAIGGVQRQRRAGTSGSGGSAWILRWRNWHERKSMGDQPGRRAPYKGWQCVDVVDLGPTARSADETDYATCQMCGNEKIRYVHIMEHPDLDENFDVGCVCAEKMSGDYEGPKRREAKLRNRAARRNPMAATQVAGVRQGEQFSERRSGTTWRPHERSSSGGATRSGTGSAPRPTQPKTSQAGLFDDFWAATQDDERLWASDRSGN